MSFNDLFRKKSVAQILRQVEKDGSEGAHGSLSKHLGVRDLTAFGIAAIIGAGIFSTIGNASANAGPGVIFLFIFTAIACSFAAFAYAEFASMVPVAGSAYTYSYVAFGELIAWIIGWALIMEYAIGNITVAISWSDYFTGLLSSLRMPYIGIENGINLPEWITMDYVTAMKGHSEAMSLIEAGKTFDNLPAGLQSAYNAWVNSPGIGNVRLIADIPALFIIVLITWLVYRGMKESRNASNAMVVVKLAVILLVIAVGIFHVDTDNWNPFAPNGVSGILKGISAVFFAYIGFDAISTTAEECKDPQRDLPRGMMWAIIICTILYVTIALVLTGMIRYNELAVGDPLAFVFEKLDLKWMSGIIAVSAIIAMASVLLVFQLGQPRIWMSMSRDGLLPKKFSKVHPKFKTPSFSTIVVGFLVAIPALFMNLTMVTDLCSIGTLFAFVLVCAGVLKLQNDPSAPRGKFKTPYINSKFIMPVLVITAGVLLFTQASQETMDFIKNTPKIYSPSDFVGNLEKDEIEACRAQIMTADSAALAACGGDIEKYLSETSETDYGRYETLIQGFRIAEEKKFESGWNLFRHKIPIWVFILITIWLTFLSVTKNLSLIPLLGLICCLYMMAELGLHNWIGFGAWLALGLVIYFTYGYKNSKLRNTTTATI